MPWLIGAEKIAWPELHRQPVAPGAQVVPMISIPGDLQSDADKVAVGRTYRSALLDQFPVEFEHHLVAQGGPIGIGAFDSSSPPIRLRFHCVEESANRMPLTCTSL
jgi:hypothetical protein